MSEQVSLTTVLAFGLPPIALIVAIIVFYLRTSEEE